MLQVPAGQFAGKLPAQVDKLPAMSGTGDHELSSRFFFGYLAYTDHVRDFETNLIFSSTKKNSEKWSKNACV